MSSSASCDVRFGSNLLPVVCALRVLCHTGIKLKFVSQEEEGARADHKNQQDALLAKNANLQEDLVAKQAALHDARASLEQLESECHGLGRCAFVVVFCSMGHDNVLANYCTVEDTYLHQPQVGDAGRTLHQLLFDLNETRGALPSQGVVHTIFSPRKIV